MEENNLMQLIEDKQREFCNTMSYDEICTLAKEIYPRYKSELHPKRINKIDCDHDSEGNRVMFLFYTRTDQKTNKDVDGCSYFIFRPDDPEAWFENWIYDLVKDYFESF